MNGPVYDLVTIMAKFLHLGMPLYDIVESVTSTPARVYGIDDVTGSLSIGKEADVTILKLEECDSLLDDCIGQMRRVHKRFDPIAVWRAGEQCGIAASRWPSKSVSQARTIASWDRAIIRDGSTPELC